MKATISCCWRSSSAPKKAAAAFKISLARRSSLISRSSSFIRARSSVVSPGRSPASVSARRTHMPQRLVVDRQLRRDRLDRLPLRRVLVLVLEDHPHRPLPDLGRVRRAAGPLLLSLALLHPLKGRSSHQSRGGSRSLELPLAHVLVTASSTRDRRQPPGDTSRGSSAGRGWSKTSARGPSCDVVVGSTPATEWRMMRSLSNPEGWR